MKSEDSIPSRSACSASGVGDLTHLGHSALLTRPWVEALLRKRIHTSTFTDPETEISNIF
jgi:hypothetical protein